MKVQVHCVLATSMVQKLIREDVSKTEFVKVAKFENSRMIQTTSNEQAVIVCVATVLVSGRQVRV